MSWWRAVQGRGKVAPWAAAAGALLAMLVPSSGLATSSQSELNLVGGDTLQANAWHCGTYVRSCSWQTSAKLLGHNPARARWIKNVAEVKAHGIRASLNLRRGATNVEVVERSRSLIKTRWINRRHWISWSRGKVTPGWTTAYVSTKASASAAHRIFGRPRAVTAYAGAF